MNKLNIANYMVYDLSKNLTDGHNHHLPEQDVIHILAHSWEQKHFISARKYKYNESIIRNNLI